MSEQRVNGVTLYYEERGAGVPILCIHGTGSSALIWGDAVRELAGLGRVIAYDRRGCTRSERPEPYDVTTSAEHAKDAAGLLEALDATPAILVGRSYGGEIAVHLTQHRPELVRALVLLEPAILTMSPPARAWLGEVTAQVRSVATSEGAGRAAEHFYRRVLGDQTWEAFPAEVREVVMANGPAILAELAGEAFVPDEQRLAQLTQPVLIVSGEISPPAFRQVDDVLTGMFSTARHVVVGGGHMINPATPVVLDFVRELVSSD